MHDHKFRVQPATRRGAFVLLVGMSVLTAPSTAHGQGTAGRFVLGPLQWTPTIQLREAGIDSNVFITPDDVRQDVSGSFLSQVDSMLTLGIGRVSTQGSAEYVYFDRYKSERSVNGRVGSRMDFALSRLRPAATVAWAHLKERANSEIDIRAPRRDLGYGASLGGRLTSRLAMTAAVTHDATAYDAGYAFRGADLASQLNRNTTNIVVGIRADISPFTSFFIDGGAGRDGFTAQRARNTDNFRANAGLQFAPDAVISGRASVGYHKMQPQHPTGAAGEASSFGGFTSTVGLGYTLLGVTRFDGRFQRDTTYSISTTQPFYLSTAGGLDILQTLVGPLDLALRGSREKMAYAVSPTAAARTDFIDTFGGGLSVRISTQGRVGVNYDDMKRRSTGGALFNYARRRIYTSVTYGF